MPAVCGAPEGPLGPIKKKAAFAAREGAGCPTDWAAPESPLADFGSASGRAGREVAREVTAPGRPARANKEKSNAYGGAG